jgi:hypothetical protein
MAKIKDLWFLQNDVKKIFDTHTKLKNKWTILFEKRMSAIEHYTYLSIPIAKTHSSKIIHNYNWGSDDSFTKKNIFHLNGKQFLAVGFRRQYNLYLFGNEYREKNKPKVFAKIERDDLGETEIIRCSILTNILAEYLKDTKQDLLFGIRSHRYSERYLSEFGLRKKQTDFKSNRKNYFYLLQTPTKMEKLRRFRAKSMSMVFGKYLIHI